ncbi:hypothetical protein [Actinomadura kijaniata]|uniref:hypothetical protein n=1 Tax=Actinomadura kijaniata TaxID=46161 RepID=UPI000833B5D8|nr:hypothetical protein [Actinomadura kijaniata]
MPHPPLSDVIDFILSRAQERDLQAVLDAYKQRYKNLQDLRAAGLQVGDTIAIDNIKPAYLRGLTGTITQISGRHCTLELDEESTDQLRHTPRAKIRIPDTIKRYPVTGMPLTSCFKLGNGKAVPCKFCNKSVNATTAHRHDDGWVGDECCWDERLRATE